MTSLRWGLNKTSFLFNYSTRSTIKSATAGFLFRCSLYLFLSLFPLLSLPPSLYPSLSACPALSCSSRQFVKQIKSNCSAVLEAKTFPFSAFSFNFLFAALSPFCSPSLLILLLSFRQASVSFGLCLRASTKLSHKLTDCPTVWRARCLSVSSFICLLVSLSLSPSVSLSASLSVCLPLSVFFSASLSVWLFIL